MPYGVTSAVSFPWKSIGVLRLIGVSPFLYGHHLLGERSLHVTISLRETTCYLDGVVCVGAVGRWWIVSCSIALLLGFWSFVCSSFLDSLGVTEKGHWPFIWLEELGLVNIPRIFGN